MIGENRWLGTNEPVEFEEWPVEVRDFRRNTGHVREIYKRIYLNLIKQHLSTCKPVGLANTRISTNYAQKSPRTLGWAVVDMLAIEALEFTHGLHL